MPPLAVIADIHGNLPALEAVLADLRARRISEIVNLGDCASGPLWPRETCARLMQERWPTVRGNHDRWVGAGQPSGASDRYALQELEEAQIAWLRGLQSVIHREGTTLFHGTPADDDSYLLEDIEGRRLVRATPETVAGRAGTTTGSVLLCGHSHQQHAVALSDGRLVVNPGSVGCPAYSDPDNALPHVSETATPHARYAILQPGENGRTDVEFVLLAYEYENAAKRAQRNERPDWAHALRTGLMPAR